MRVEISDDFKNHIRELSKDETSCFKCLRVKRLVPLCPYQLNDILNSLNESFDEHITTYDKELEGYIFDYTDIKLMNPGSIYGDSMYIYYLIEATLYLFTPKPGLILEAKVTKKSSQYISCIAYSLYNIAVTKPSNPKYSIDPKINDNVLIRILSLDTTNILPHITGELVFKKHNEYKTWDEVANEEEKLDLNGDVKLKNSKKRSHVDDGDDSFVKKKKLKKRKVLMKFPI